MDNSETGNAISLLHAVIDKMAAKYASNEPVLAKFINHVHQIPSLLTTVEETLNQRTERKKVLTMTSDEFIEQFLSDSTHNYFYNGAIDLFFEYDNVKYCKIEEDDIVYAALTTLQDYPDLKPWKYKIKNQILKRIKDRELLNSIPESCTIQNVIGIFYPAVFSSRDAAKHFLTVLGDILNKKNTNYYFISARAKRFIQELSLQCCALFGIPSLTNVFKFKFYEHTFSECRLLNVNELGVRAIKLGEYSSPFKRSIVDILCVSSHYSKRFGSADSFLESPYCKDASLSAHCFYLKTNDELSIINKFVSKTTEPCDNYNITWKKMQYLWKLFLEDENLPYIMFTNQLKAHLTSILPCKATGGDANDDENCAGTTTTSCSDIVFTGITSKHLPIVSDFLAFWKETIIVIGDVVGAAATSSAASREEEDELEIDELAILFISYVKTRKPSQKNLNNLNITDELMHGLVKHFFSEIQIEDDKYIMNVTSRMWNKKKEIKHALLMTASMSTSASSDSNPNVSSVAIANEDVLFESADLLHQQQSQVQSPHAIYNAYERYCAHSYSHKSFVVSKRYFEKYYDEIMKQ